jgi:glycine cleavage system H lipoate-binding protein
MSGTGEIPSVLGGQVWMIRPDKAAQEAHPCLWMQAGVVALKGCNNFYDCTSCKYDAGMRKQVESGKKQSWQDAMRHRPDLERACRHSLTGRIPHRLCAYDYQCASCDFDQLFEDFLNPKTQSRPSGMLQVKGFDVPQDHYFHEGHAWARIESGGCLRVGLDDFSLRVFGEADGLDLPLMGYELNQGTAGWGLRRKGNLADVLSPVDGIVTEVNEAIRENPRMANQEPYGEGWLFVVHHPNLKKTVKPLMADEDCLGWMNAEVQTLEEMIEAVAGPLAADGGTIAGDVYGSLPGLGWEKLARRFLKTG